jgi:wyosine [tRNA(Phe)-imidazoG37] synthetase (radical SAM superfamily)
MLIKNVNDSDYDLEKYKDILKTIRYDKLYINTPIRPPAESNVHASDHERGRYAADYLNGLSIDLLASTGFQSSIKDDYEAILSIIKRHPMNQYEIESFLNSRNVKNIKDLLRKLNSDVIVNVLDYKGYKTYRLK